jgi:lipid II:glycine glycyltransferase (peptidoglycan interpeptide bridge formation enzyme)
VFYWGRQATGWNGTAHRDFLKYKVIPVAHIEMIRDAISRGYSYMDFSTSGHREQLITFKQSFNPISVPLCGWLYENPLIGSSRAMYGKGRQALATIRRANVAPAPEPSDQSSITQPNAPELDA